MKQVYLILHSEKTPVWRCNCELTLQPEPPENSTIYNKCASQRVPVIEKQMWSFNAVLHLCFQVIVVSSVPGMDSDWLMGERGSQKGKVPITYLELLNWDPQSLLSLSLSLCPSICPALSNQLWSHIYMQGQASLSPPFSRLEWVLFAGRRRATCCRHELGWIKWREGKANWPILSCVCHTFVKPASLPFFLFDAIRPETCARTSPKL